MHVGASGERDDGFVCSHAEFYIARRFVGDRQLARSPRGGDTYAAALAEPCIVFRVDVEFELGITHVLSRSVHNDNDNDNA